MPNDLNESNTIRAAALSDASAIAAIYNHYISKSIATFVEEPVSASEISRRIEEVQSAAFPWLVAEEGGQITGYTYADRWKPRSSYRFSAAVTVYVAPGLGGRGIGSKLYGRLFPLLEARQIHAVMGGIAQPNEASVALHEKFGMRKVAEFKEVGFKFGRWIDVGYWQRLFRTFPPADLPT